MEFSVRAVGWVVGVEVLGSIGLAKLGKCLRRNFCCVWWSILRPLYFGDSWYGSCRLGVVGWALGGGY